MIAKLTPRESEVFNLIRRGLINKDIAVAMRISTRTVKFHLANIIGKSGRPWKRCVWERCNLRKIIRIRKQLAKVEELGTGMFEEKI